jgi:hypothetical protein
MAGQAILKEILRPLCKFGSIYNHLCILATVIINSLTFAVLRWKYYLNVQNGGHRITNCVLLACRLQFWRHLSSLQFYESLQREISMFYKWFPFWMEKWMKIFYITK